MRSSLARAAVIVAGALAFTLAAAAPASADLSQYCVYVPSFQVGIGPRPMSTTYTMLCVPWP